MITSPITAVIHSHLSVRLSFYVCLLVMDGAQDAAIRCTLYDCMRLVGGT